MALLRYGERRLKLKKEYARRDNMVSFPDTIMIRITHENNLKPTYCGQWAMVGIDYGLNKSGWVNQLGTLQWKKFIKQVAPGKPYIFIEGGEPLLRRDIVELVAFISSCGLLCGLRTNGTLLEKYSDGLTNSKLDYILCNLDAPESVNAQITGNADSFSRTVAGVKSLVNVRNKSKDKLPHIQITTSINKENQNYLFDMAKIAEELCVDVFAINFPVFTTPELERKTDDLFKSELGIESKFWKGFINNTAGIDCGIVEEQIKKVRSSNWKFIYRQFPLNTNHFNIRTHFCRPDIVHEDRKCLLPWALAVILPNGDVATCWDHPDYIVDNILNEKFIDIWNNKKMRKFRGIIKEKIFPTCSRCNALYFLKKI